jgi:transposase InsO family protein
MNTIPKLTGHDDYILWLDQILAAFRYCGVDKILTGDWPAPAVIAGDTATETNAHEWNCIDSFIQLNMGLSNEVRSQVRHLHTSSERWLELKKLYQPTSATSITLHLTSIVNVRFDDSTKFEDFVAGKREHNRLLGELGGQSLPDSYIAILIRSGLPEHLHQTVAHIADDKITTDQLVNIVRSRQQESMINTMQTSSSDTALFGRKGKPNQKKHDFQPCRTAGCPKPETHPTKNCWAPGGPKYDPNRQRKSDRRGMERAHKINEGDDDDDGGATSMNILIDRSFFATQSDSDLLYVSPSESSTSSMLSQAFIAEGSTPIIIDSGMTSHIHTERSDFDYLDKDDTNSITGFGNGSVSSSGRGTAVIWTKSPQRKDSVNRLSLTKALYVPSSNVSLLSVSKFDKAGCRIEFANGRCTISDAKTNDIILTGTMRKDLYYLDNITRNTTTEVRTKVYHTTNSEITLDLMHRHLGHLNMRAVKLLFKKDMVRGVTLSEKHLKSTPSLCECCIRGKMQRTPLPKSASRSAEILGLVHSDLWGPSAVMSLGGRYYFISFTDDSARYSWLYQLRKKSEAFGAFKAWHKEVERQTGRKLRVFRSDNGGEYITLEWELYMKEHGIVHQKTTPRTPEQNGVSERLNLTLMDRVRTILIESQLPLSLWAEAVNYAVYTKNRSPTAAINGKTPYEVFWGEKPDISNLRVFGSQCYVHNNSPTRRKFDARAFPAVFIGYSTPSKAWKYYIPSRRKVGTSRNIIFDERVRSSVTHHNIEGELAATGTSTYHDLLVPTPASESNLDDGDDFPLKAIAPTPASQVVEPSTSQIQNPEPSTSSSPLSPSQLAPSSPNYLPAPSISTPLPPSVTPPDPPPFHWGQRGSYLAGTL